jgi:hypothetical protein
MSIFYEFIDGGKKSVHNRGQHYHRRFVLLKTFYTLGNGWGMETMIACCGLECLQCPAFPAGRDDDDGLRVQTAREWSVQFNVLFIPESFARITAVMRRQKFTSGMRSARGAWTRSASGFLQSVERIKQLLNFLVCFERKG